MVGLGRRVLGEMRGEGVIGSEVFSLSLAGWNEPV